FAIKSDRSAEMRLERPHLPSGGELSTRKGRPPSFMSVIRQRIGRNW
ncbi:10185_t:CDS:1, partial [Funneliformis caledonium]